jgi:hypothetical protein
MRECFEWIRFMSMRLVTCEKCNYKNRFGRRHCSYCFAETSLLNRLGFWLSLAAASGVVGALYVV